MVKKQHMKNLINLLIAVVTLVSCSKQTPEHTTVSANEKLVTHYYSLFNAHKWTEMAAMYAEISDFKDPSLGSGIVKQTHQQIIEKYTQLHQMFPNIKDEIIQIYPAGDKHIVVEFLSTGTAPDSTTFELPICTIFTIENGKITKDFTYYDNFQEGQSK